MKLLIVDDEKIICDGLKTLVERLELPEIESVRTAYTPRDAVQIADSLRPELLVTDIRMPGKTGLELIADLRETLPELRAIVVTGHDDFELVREALRLETIDYLLKPATRAELRQAIERAIEDISVSRGRTNDRIQDEELYFDSIVSAAWPWFAEGVQMTSDTIRRLAHALEDHVGRDHLAMVALDSSGFPLDEAEDLMRRAAESRHADSDEGSRAGVPLVVMRRESNAIVAVAGGTARRAVEGMLDELRHSLRGTSGLHLATSAVSEGLFSLPQLARSVRLARIARLGDEASVHTMASSGPEPFEASVPARAEALLKSASDANRHAEALELVNESARTPRILDGVWSELQALVDRASGKRNSLPPLESLANSDAVVRAIRAAAAAETADDAEPPVVQRAREFVAAHYHEQYTMHDVADRLGISYAYFSTLFKDHTGETFSHFLIRTRMEHARRLLDEVRLPISDVATRVGYLYPRHFSRAFKGFYGVTPQQYLSGKPVSRDTEASGESPQS